jgi:hypothetical protein
MTAPQNVVKYLFLAILGLFLLLGAIPWLLQPITGLNASALQFRISRSISALVSTRDPRSFGNYNLDRDNSSFPEFDAGPSDGGYADRLKSLQEGSLRALPNASCLNVYRFLWFRSFHNWISIKVEHHKDGTTTVYAKEFDRRTNAGPNPLLERKFDWSTEEYASFINKIDSLKFWDSQSILTITERELSTDGAAWMLEGVDEHRYHFVVRRGADSSDTKPVVKEVGLFLLEKTKLLPPKGQMY